ncbi:MAG: hypothetical protein NXI20_04290 [bacterium]|nr:hypothetical protein [bacterium]
MRTLILLISTPLLLIGQFEAHSQIDSFSKIVLKKKETRVFFNDTLVIDTLIMEDRATMELKSDTYLLIKHAYLGDKASILAEGKGGSNANVYGKPGETGGDGYDLMLEINFETLGSLTVSTRGGKGGNGKSIARNTAYPNDVSVSVDQYGTVTTRRKVRATSTRAGNGGHGGKGGDLTIRYSTNGFIPTFNGSQNTKEVKNRNQSINILIEGGEKGLPSQGAGRSLGTYGTPGENGVLKIERVE